jgi:hypothetical protein
MSPNKDKGRGQSTVQEMPEKIAFLTEFRNNLPEIEKLLEAWAVHTIHENRPWWKYAKEILD